MLYFLPDSQDLVDPSYDFSTERRARTRLRQRDDLYAHELFRDRAFDGLLVSKGIVDSFGASGGRYTLAQRQRLLREGAPRFFRAKRPDGTPIPVMGDCGAFTYVKEPVPPYSVDEVISFYSDCGFNFGISVDHVILDYDASLDTKRAAPRALRDRQDITLTLAAEFLRTAKKSRVRFEPLGVAQGWSPASYAHATRELQKMGYGYVAVGGMVPLKTPDILDILRAVNDVRRPRTRLHLLGVTRTESIGTFASLGAASFDSTSPLRQAFMDDKDNYYTLDRAYVALRVPQVEGNPTLQRGISAGRIPQDRALRLERAALDTLEAFHRRRASLDRALNALLEYERLYDPKLDHESAYRETLAARPWDACRCEVCATLGHQVIVFRGAERNRRRGFHNVWTFYRRLHKQLGRPLRIARGAT